MRKAAREATKAEEQKKKAKQRQGVGGSGWWRREERTNEICTDNLRAVTAPRSSVRLNRPELSPMAR